MRRRDPWIWMGLLVAVLAIIVAVVLSEGRDHRADMIAKHGPVVKEESRTYLMVTMMPVGKTMIPIQSPIVTRTVTYKDGFRE